jgi:hypothetical protein
MNWTTHPPACQQSPPPSTPPPHSVVSIVRSYGVPECETSSRWAPRAQPLRPVKDQPRETRTSERSFPYIAAWAGGEGPKAVVATQARVGQAASAIIAVSPAEHGGGGPVPGADLALEAAREASHAPVAATITPNQAPTVWL